MPNASGVSSLPPDVALRLMAIKQLLVEGEALAARPDEPGRMLAVLQLDLAVESALKLLLSAKGTPIGTGAKFPQLVEAAKKLIAVSTDVVHLHTVRNGAQHQGITPAAEVMDTGRGGAMKCVRDVFAALGAKYETFNLVDLVINPLLQDPLPVAAQAEEADHAIALAAYAFYLVRGMYEEIAGAAIGLEMWVLGKSRIADIVETVSCADGKDDAVASAIKVMAHLGMGLDLVEYAQFRRISSGRIALLRDGKWAVAVQKNELKRTEVVEADVAWMLDYVSRQIVRLERAHPVLRVFDHSMVDRDPERLRHIDLLPVRPRRLGAG